jgi:DNA polymerase-3 subunit gamma/tau
MGKALYRKYRSRSLDEIVGQEHVTALLKRALERGRIAHAYLLTGPRGVGKTSIARILAHDINQLPYTDESTHLDIIEIDAASNNGVEDIRDLRDKVQIAPVSAKKKVYIIDEVHMLSKPAFNALLKTLEEPPEHVVFILATTDVEKLPETIISRTQRYTVRRATIDELITNMTRIAASENIMIEPEALRVIAEHSDGGYRDSVSLLDQLANIVSEGESITAGLVEQSLGLAPTEQINSLLKSVQSGDLSASLQSLRGLESRGVQPTIIAEQCIQHIRDTIESFGDLFPLMNELIEVNKSSLPNAKLLAVLGGYCTLRNPLPSVEKPKTTPKHEPKPLVVAQKPKIAEEKIEKPVNTADQEAAKVTKSKSANVEFDWSKFVEAIRTASVALYSVVSKCGYELKGAHLTLYTRNEFYKKKLDNPRALGILHSALANQADVEWEVTMLGTTKLPSDSQTAAIAAMMGGGEEVQIDER